MLMDITDRKDLEAAEVPFAGEQITISEKASNLVRFLRRRNS